tara:strand:- start:1363 stop:2256 length:894 start_codon:yes stop_codon:yes gene_type:complete
MRQVSQLGADGIDFGNGTAFPGVTEQGYPDLDKVVRIKKRIHSWGLEINRVTLPDITEKFMQNQPGGERELENSCEAVRIFAQAGIPIVRQRFAGDTFDLSEKYLSVHRGGYTSRGERPNRSISPSTVPTYEELDQWWDRFVKVYNALVPIAEETGVLLALHPSDIPHPNTPFGGLGFHRVIDAFPSANVGYLYCCGTRAEAGGSSIVLDEINNYGRKGKIFTVHMRNVRGSLATAEGFEEVLLDDGDMNIAKIFIELKKVGFDGFINPDHIPNLEGGVGLAYSVGYLKAILASLAI